MVESTLKTEISSLKVEICLEKKISIQMRNKRSQKKG